jgi:VIT1/CCC1 family predicted Fe2+/Mn2+ transporter
VSDAPLTTAPEHDEAHDGSIAGRLNWLRAGVLGANDGIVSTAGLVIGVAAATTERGAVLTAGLAGLAAGAMSMAVGEYVSVSTQRDTEQAIIAEERREIAEMPDAEHAELVGMLRQRGLSSDLSRAVADELTANDALRAHLDVEFGIDQHDLVNPWVAAGSSALAFTIGALLPLIAILVPPESARIAVAFVAVLIGLLITGLLSASVARSRRVVAVARLVVGGALAMAVTFGIGSLLN